MMITPDKSITPNGISTPDQLPNIDLTALIDIIFIVLVFLLLTANSQLLSLPVDVVARKHNTASLITSGFSDSD